MLFGACDKSNVSGVNFDRGAMLASNADLLIIPNYQVVQTQINAVATSQQTYLDNPDATNLAALRTEFRNLYFVWQDVAQFEVGPAVNISLRSAINTFPTDADQINQNISSGSYNLATADNLDARGLPAIDYMLYGIGADDAAILAKYTTDPDAVNYKVYLADLLTDVKDNIDAVVTDWMTDYRQSFINASGTDVGSSVGQMVNQLAFDLEVVKNAKIGIPLGKKTLGDSCS